jgi:hypothetical protein
LTAGWLAEGHEFPLGDVPGGFVDALLEPAEDTVNVYRGRHFRDFCPVPVPERRIRGNLGNPAG